MISNSSTTTKANEIESRSVVITIYEDDEEESKQMQLRRQRPVIEYLLIAVLVLFAFICGFILFTNANTKSNEMTIENEERNLLMDGALTAALTHPVSQDIMVDVAEGIREHLLGGPPQPAYNAAGDPLEPAVRLHVCDECIQCITGQAHDCANGCGEMMRGCAEDIRNPTHECGIQTLFTVGLASTVASFFACAFAPNEHNIYLNWWLGISIAMMAVALIWSCFKR